MIDNFWYLIISKIIKFQITAEPDNATQELINNGADVSDLCTNQYVLQFGYFMIGKYNYIRWMQYAYHLHIDEYGENQYNVFPCAKFCNESSLTNGGAVINIQIGGCFCTSESVSFFIQTLIVKEKNGVNEFFSKIFNCEYKKENYNMPQDDEIELTNKQFYDYLETVDTTTL
jgi:hypothetical protein